MQARRTCAQRIAPSSDPILLAASLRCAAEVACAHDNSVRALACNTDGSRIVSSSFDGTIRVWDAVALRPYNASEWEKVFDEEQAQSGSEIVYYWMNLVTGELRENESTAGAPADLNRQNIRSATPIARGCRFHGTEGGENGGARSQHPFCGVQPR